MEILRLGPNTDYTAALALQEDAVERVLAGGDETVFFLEHSPVITLGSNGDAADILNAEDIPIIETGRGGQVTFHGPGQLVIYPILDLKRRKQDLRWYVKQLQHWLCAGLAEYGLEGQITDDVGVWVNPSSPLPALSLPPAKIAQIGIRVRKWITFHGVALNVRPDLTNFNRIIPCGLADKPVTSMLEQGLDVTVDEVTAILSGLLGEFLGPSS